MIDKKKLFDAYLLFHEGQLALAEIERAGIRIDIEKCLAVRQDLSDKISACEEEFKKTFLFQTWEKTFSDRTNILSNVQLEHVLFKVLKLKPIKATAKGRNATDEESLMQLGIADVNVLLRYRKLRKIRDTYLEGFIREQTDGVLHPFFNLHTVRTYRSSSDHPNFQNIPRRDTFARDITRKVIFPRKGHQLLEVDYSGLEVSIAACYHKDPEMLKYLKSGADLHSDLAKKIFNVPVIDKTIPVYKKLRDAAKNGFVFPQFYGDYYKNNVDRICDWIGLSPSREIKEWDDSAGIKFPSGLTIAQHLKKQGVKCPNDFEAHMARVERWFWKEKFKVYDEWKSKWVTSYQKQGYFQTLTGFICKGEMRKNEVVNYPIQGSAFHCLLWSLIQLVKIQKKEGWDSRIVGQIHDSMIVDVNPAELMHVAKVIKKVTCEDLPRVWQWIIVPLSVEMELCPVDSDWTCKKLWEIPET